MMKKFILIALISLAAFTSVAQTSTSKEITVDSIRYSVDVSTRTATLVSGKNRHGALILSTTVTDGVYDYTITKIGNSAFADGNITYVSIPRSFTTIGIRAFLRCKKLTKVNIGSGLKLIEAEAFLECDALRTYSVRSDNATFSSNDGVLFNKTGTTLIAYPNAKGATYNIPSTVNKIGETAFVECTGLKQVTIPNSVTTIGGYAFYGCSGLTHVAIPNSVTTIGRYAFYGCTSFKLVCCGRKEPIAIESSVLKNVSLSEAVLVVTDKQAYASADVWKDFGTIVGMDTGLKGDLNEDGKVDVSDVTSLMGIILQ